MSAFTNLNDALRAMKTDPSTAGDPIKRMFLCVGQFITANVSIIEDSGNALHTQPSHDEIVLIIGGEANFRVGDEMSHVSAGDMIFIPQNTLHGPIIPEGGRLEVLSIFAPFFDRSKKKLIHRRDDPKVEGNRLPSGTHRKVGRNSA
jgi:quercetin dioxygenase-like cupin family protein